MYFTHTEEGLYIKETEDQRIEYDGRDVLVVLREIRGFQVVVAPGYVTEDTYKYRVENMQPVSHVTPVQEDNRENLAQQLRHQLRHGELFGEDVGNVVIDIL